MGLYSKLKSLSGISHIHQTPGRSRACWRTLCLLFCFGMSRVHQKTSGLTFSTSCHHQQNATNDYHSHKCYVLVFWFSCHHHLFWFSCHPVIHLFLCCVPLICPVLYLCILCYFIEIFYGNSCSL